MGELFDTIIDFNQAIFRNIVRQAQHIDPFADLVEHDPSLSNVAKELVDDITQKLSSWHYQAAVIYPFKNIIASRYSDGTFPIWYGSLEQETTFYETAFHMIQAESNIDGIEDFSSITRDRTLYAVPCQAILIDLRGKEKPYPKLVSYDYDFTQSLGNRLYQEGHPGFLTPSARCPGNNANIFKQDTLGYPVDVLHLTYTFVPKTREIQIHDGAMQLLLVI